MGEIKNPYLKFPEQTWHKKRMFKTIHNLIKAK